MIRPSCGTLRGAQAHATAGESQCGWCVTAAEAIPARPTPPGHLPPVTPELGAHHLAVLASELEAYYEARAAARADRHLRALPALTDQPMRRSA